MPDKVTQAELFPLPPKAEPEALQPGTPVWFGPYRGQTIQEACEKNYQWTLWYVEKVNRTISPELQSLLRNYQLLLK